MNKFDIDFSKALQIVKVSDQVLKPIDVSFENLYSLIGESVEVTQPNSKWVIKLTISNIIDIAEWTDFQCNK